MSFYLKRWYQAFEMVKETNGAFNNYDGMSEMVHLTTAGALANSLKRSSKFDIFAGKINKAFCRLNC